MPLSEYRWEYSPLADWKHDLETRGRYATLHWQRQFDRFCRNGIFSVVVLDSF